MSDDRQSQATAEARARFSGGPPLADLNARHGFTQGVGWADANPQPRTITLAQSEAILEAGRAGGYEDHEAALRAAGIDVEDDDE